MVSDNLKLKIFLEIQYHFMRVACKFLKIAFSVYFDEVQMPSILDQRTQDGQLEAHMECFR